MSTSGSTTSSDSAHFPDVGLPRKRLTSPGFWGGFTRSYQTLALLVLNTVLAVSLINAAAYLVLRFSAAARRGNVVAQRHGSTRLRRVYPDLDANSIDELLKETWGKPQFFEPYTLFGESPRTGKFVNVHAAGFRFSKNQGRWPPDPDAYNIFVFGGSTTFSYGLPDSQTVPSYLQEAVSARMKPPVFLYNFGAGSYQSSQERILFQELLIKGARPAMAIFIDGLNDFAFRDGPEFTDEVRYLIDQYNSAQGKQAAEFQLIGQLPAIQLAKRIRAKFRSAAPRALPNTNPTDPIESQAVVQSVAQRYFENKRQIEAIAATYGIEPVFAWQPVPFYKCSKSCQIFPDLSGLNRYAQAGYQYVRTFVTTRPASNFLWCADIQEGLAEPLYVDAVHYDAAMSQRLARYIAQLLSARKLLPEDSFSASISSGKQRP
jgi:lysophospholipase L1-like esterase